MSWTLSTSLVCFEQLANQLGLLFEFFGVLTAVTEGTKRELLLFLSYLRCLLWTFWMNEPTAKMRAFAQLLIAQERKGNKSSEPDGATAFGGVVEKLRRPLAAVAGVAGFRSVLSRALALANGEARWLLAVHIKADGSLELPAEIAQLDKEEVVRGEVVLVAQLLSLLVTFIGERLTLHLVRDVWPEAPIER